MGEACLNSIGSLREKEVVIGLATFEGETKNGMKHGRGTLVWEGGDQVPLYFFGHEKNLSKKFIYIQTIVFWRICQ